jgi:hypothetical protein
MRTDILRIGLQGIILVGAATLVACAGRQHSIGQSLLARDTVCLHLMWSSEPPRFGDLALPDTIWLVAGGERSDGLGSAPDAWGSVLTRPAQSAEFAALEQWWLARDTLVIETLTPPMDDFVIWAALPDRGAGKWSGGYPGQVNGEVELRHIGCQPSTGPAA